MGLFDGFQGGEKIAVMSIHDAIKAELDRHEFNYEETDESGESRRERYIYMRNELENDEPVTVVIAIREYDHADGFIKIKIYDIAYLEEAENRAGLLAKLNEWNSEYRYVKFVVDDERDVVVDIDLPLDLHKGVFQADSFMAMVGVGLQVLEEVYPELMKLRWA